MIWKVTYRDSDGNRASADFDASSRQDLFAQLECRGLNALSVEESATGTKPVRAQRPGRPRNGYARALLAGSIVVVGAFLGVWWLVSRRAPAPQPVRESATPDGLLPEVAPSATNTVAAATNAVAKAGPEKRYYKGVEVKSSKVSTNALDGAIVESLRLADGRRVKVVQLPRPLFEHSSDQLIAMAVNVEPGHDMPPLPIDAGVEDSFAKSLLSPIEIRDDDSESVRELKAKVIEARAYIAQEIKAGKTVRQVLTEFQTQMHEIADSHLMAIRETQKIRDEYGVEDAALFVKRVNESFRARGIPELPVPKEDSAAGESEGGIGDGGEMSETETQKEE